MSQTLNEITKEIVIAAIQSGHVGRVSSAQMTTAEMSEKNADLVSEFYKKIYQTVSGN